MTINAFGQNSIPNLELNSKLSAPHELYDQLKMQDSESLLIEFHLSSYWNKKKVLNILYYNIEGAIRYYQIRSPKDSENYRVKKIKLNKAKQSEIIEYIMFLTQSGSIDLNPDRLNIRRKPIDEETSKYISVYDGVTYNLSFIQNKGFSKFYSYSPDTYIREKFPGYEERQKLVDIVRTFYRLTNS